MAGFGLPNFGQLTEAFRKAQQIQQDAQKLQEELDAMELEGCSADGRASVWLTGNQLPLKVRVEPALLSEGATAVAGASNEAEAPAPAKSPPPSERQTRDAGRVVGLRSGRPVSTGQSAQSRQRLCSHKPIKAMNMGYDSATAKG